MKKHDGNIEVSSEPGRGTTCILYLPAREEKPVVRESGKSIPRAGQGRILVMDDEAMVRDIVGVMIQKLGYTVCFAEDGRDAIGQFQEARQGGKPFDAVIMDLTVPGGMGGREAMKELLRIDPHVKAIVSSGYSNDPITANYRQHGFAGVLAKPYKMSDLGSILEEVLSSD
jgi:two-component system cell cycle sensor histidine kinase/response regulator CckA